MFKKDRFWAQRLKGLKGGHVLIRCNDESPPLLDKTLRHQKPDDLLVSHICQIDGSP